MTLSRSILLTGLVLAAGAAAPAHAQGLLGQPVDVKFLVGSTVLSDYGTQTITSGGNAFTPPVHANPPPFYAFVTPTQITYTANSFASYGNGNFYLVASEVGALPATITGVTVDPSTTVPGFPASDLTFDGSDVSAQIAGVGPFQSGETLVLDVASTPAAVPEASTTVSFGLLLALGLGGVLIAKKKMRQPTL